MLSNLTIVLAAGKQEKREVQEKNIKTKVETLGSELDVVD